MYRYQYCNEYKLVMDTISANVYLQSHGIKPSLQRIAIVEYMMKNRIHPTADEIYNALYIKVPTLSKTTVYNTLKLFAGQGAVQVLGIDEKNVRFDIDVSGHAHFKCNGCHKIFDLPLEDPALLQVKQIGDFVITEAQLYYKGYCKECSVNF